MTQTATDKPATKRTLLNIADDMVALDNLLEETGGDVTDPEVEAAIDSFMAELQTDLDNKTDNYCGLIRQKELLAACRKEEAERLRMAAKAEENQAKYLKDRLKLVLEFLGVKKAGKVRTASVCNNGGKQPLIMPPVTDPDMIPERFRKVISQVVVDEDKVREALEAGEDLGSFAQLAPRGTHLRIK